MAIKGKKFMSDFESERKKGALRVPHAVIVSIESILNFLWEDEFRDYQSRAIEARKGHVFRDLLVVRRYLNKKKHAQKKGS